MNTKKHNHHKAESGQAIVLIALLFVVLAGMTGLAVDGGGLFFMRRDIQGAVDNAILAGAYNLCVDLQGSNRFDEAESSIRQVLTRSGVTETEEHIISVTVQQPTSGPFAGRDAIEVVVTAVKPSYFAQVVYPEPLEITVRGTAACDTSNQNAYEGYALYATGTTCGSQQLRFSGSTGYFEGGLFSNGDMQINTAGVQIEGAVTVAGDPVSMGTCGDSECWAHVTINGESGETMLTQVENLTNPVEPPLLYHMDDFRPLDDLTGGMACTERDGDPAYCPQRDGSGAILGGTHFEHAKAGNMLFYFGPDGALGPAGVNLGPAHDPLVFQGYDTYVPYNISSGFSMSGQGGRPAMPTEGLIVFDSTDRGPDHMLGTWDDPTYDFQASGNGFNAGAAGFTLVSTGKILFSSPGNHLGQPFVDDLQLFSWAGAYADTSVDSNGLADNPIWEDDPLTPEMEPLTYGSCSNHYIQTPSASSTYNGLVYAPFGNINVPMSSNVTYGQIIGYSIGVNLASGSFYFSNDSLPEGQPGLIIGE